jgi:integrase
MATVNFLYRSNRNKAALTLRLLYRHEGVDFVFASKTKEFVEKEYWTKHHNSNTKNALIKNRQVDIKTELNKIENYILDSFNESQTETIDKDWLTEQIDSYYNPIEEKKLDERVTYWVQYVIDNTHLRENAKGGIGLSESRIKAYKQLKRLFQEFQGKNNYKVVQLNKLVFEDFKKWLLDEMEYAKTYGLKKISDLITICKEAKSKGVEVSHELDSIKVSKAKAYDDDMDVITLTLDDIEKIENVKLTKEHLINARKWLILACFTGQRGETLTKRVTYDSFEDFGNNLVIKIIQKKGAKPVTIPVTPRVKSIYKEGLPYKISIQNLNKYFKEIGQLAKLDDMVEGRLVEVIKRNDGSKIRRGVKKSRPKHKYISSHIGRRTFASLHYNKLPTPMIMKVTGHKKESTFLTYINQSSDDHIDAFLEYYKKEELKAQKKPQLKVIKKAN